jgi:acyl-lipid omega-6 desaturase (Delta-12 desaturase)
MEQIQELQQAKTTTLRPKDILACLRLKAWDPETQRMVGHREMGYASKLK